MIRRFIKLCAAFVCGAGFGQARGAQIYTETFPLDSSGWTAYVLLGSGEWNWVGGNLQLDYYFIAPPDIPPPDEAILLADSLASGGKFTGNWTAAGIGAVGFDFTSDTKPPSGIQVTLTNGVNSFYVGVAAPPVGVTESFLIPVDSLAAGGWTGVPDNSEAGFAALKTNVASVLIQILRNGMTSTTYHVDNFFTSQTFQWDGGNSTHGGSQWLATTNWFPDGIPGANSRVIFGSTGTASTVAINSSLATGGVTQVGQMLVSGASRTFLPAPGLNQLQFNAYGGLLLAASNATVTFNNSGTNRLGLVVNRYHGEFNTAANASIIVSNCPVSETNYSCRIEKTGAGLLYLGVSNNYSGGTWLKAGTLRIGHSNALGSGALTVDSGLVDLRGNSIAVPALSGDGGTISDSGSGVATTVVTVAMATNTVFSGIFSNGSEHILSIVKNGTGTLTLAGTNLNSGPTLLNAGKIFLAAASYSSSNAWPIGELGTGGITVSTGAVFGGVGRVRGSVTNSGLILPGSPVTGVLVCASDYVQNTNGAISFFIGGTNPAQNRAQFTPQVLVTTNAGTTNTITNLVAMTTIYNRAQVEGNATLAGLIKATLATNFVPATGALYHVLSAGSLSGKFSTNSLSTNNLPSPGAGREWGILYFATSVALTVTSSTNVPYFFISSPAVLEGNSGTTNLNFAVALTKPSTADVTIVYATADGTASATNNDYVAAGGSLVIPAGSITGTISIAVNGDSLYEANETMLLNIVGATNAIAGTSQATGTILNDDLPYITIGGVTRNEGDFGTTAFVFPVTLLSPLDVNVSVNFATSNGTAMAGNGVASNSDFRATNGILTIAAGATTGQITVAVNADLYIENDETFSVILSSPTNVVLATNQALGTILNDDAIPQIEVSGVTQSEGTDYNPQFRFPVLLSRPSAETVTLSFATADGTAIAGSDYYATNGYVSITPGQTSTTISVIVVGDTVVESNETFLLNVFAPTNATLNTDLAVGTILDDDAQAFSGYDIYILQVLDGQQHHFTDDPDGDGYPNLLEYITGGNPAASDSVSAISIARTNGLPALLFTRNTNSVDATIFVEATESPTNAVVWDNIASNSAGIWYGPAIVIETGTGTPVRVYVTDAAPFTNRVLRLRATYP